MRMHLVHLCQEEIRVVEVSIDEISFVLNLYSDGYFILKALENDDGDHSALQDGLKLLRPYDRNSDGLFALSLLIGYGPDASSKKLFLQKSSSKPIIMSVLWTSV